jgi:hypothetical protein
MDKAFALGNGVVIMEFRRASYKIASKRMRAEKGPIRGGRAKGWLSVSSGSSLHWW